MMYEGDSQKLKGARMAQIEVPDQFYFPHIRCSIPTRCNPYFDECLRVCEEWGKGDETIKEGPLVVCWAIPESEDREKLILASKFIGLMFAADDFLVDSAELVRDRPKLIEMLKQTILGAHAQDSGHKPGELSKKFPMFALLEETYSELRRKMPRALYARLAKGMADYFAGSRQQRRSAGHYIISSVEDYFRDRLEDGFSWPSLCIMEFCILDNDKIETMKESWADPMFYGLCRAAAAHGCLVNDLFSFRKEYYDGSWEDNVLAVLYRENQGQGGFQGAVDRCRDLIEEKDRELVRLRDEMLLREDLSNEMRTLAMNIPYLASGNLQFSALSTRYNGLRNTLGLPGEVYHGTILMHRRATIVLPPHPDAAAYPPPTPRPASTARAAMAVPPLINTLRLPPTCLRNNYISSFYKPPMSNVSPGLLSSIVTL